MSAHSIVVPSNLLQEIPLDRLREISDSDSSFYEFFSSISLDEITKIHSDRDQIIEANREFSVETLNLKPTFEEKKAKLIESNLKAAEMKEVYNEQYEKLRKLSKSFDHKELLDQLQSLLKTSEREADELTEKFLDKSSEMDLDDFIKVFMNGRITYWKRKVKSDKMDELLRHGPMSVAPKNVANVAPYPPSSMYGGHTPYPNNQPLHSLPPAHPAPYSSSSGSRRSLPTSSIPYSQPNSTPYGSMQPSQPPQYSVPRPPYPQQTGYPPSTRPPLQYGSGYSSQSSYRPPAIGSGIPYTYSYNPNKRN